MVFSNRSRFQNALKNLGNSLKDVGLGLNVDLNSRSATFEDSFLGFQLNLFQKLFIQKVNEQNLVPLVIV